MACPENPKDSPEVMEVADLKRTPGVTRDHTGVAGTPY
jgi:hypothetical protein